MIQLNLHEAKAKLSECIEAALRGERVVIAHRNVPAVELAPIPQRTAEPRKLGQGPKQPGYALPESFWEPLPGDLVAAFNGGSGAIRCKHFRQSP
jgi:prevent-host-death family protein